MNEHFVKKCDSASKTAEIGRQSEVKPIDRVQTSQEIWNKEGIFSYIDDMIYQTSSFSLNDSVAK